MKPRGVRTTAKTANEFSQSVRERETPWQTLEACVHCFWQFVLMKQNLFFILINVAFALILESQREYENIQDSLMAFCSWCSWNQEYLRSGLTKGTVRFM